MAVKTVSIKKLGREYKISPHFKLSEMACKDGSDKVLYSTELMEKLEELRAYGGFTVSINSGYRTPAYNKKIGGASRSQHVLGNAADIVVRKEGKVVDTKKLCCLCQSLGFKGIGYISANAIHVDMRAVGSYRGDELRGFAGNVGGDFYRYYGISREEIRAMKVADEIKEKGEDIVDQKQFDQMMAHWLQEQGKKAPSGWSEEARVWAEKNGIINGSDEGYEYGRFCTREMVITFLYRFYRLTVGDVSDEEGKVMLNAMRDVLAEFKK